MKVYVCLLALVFLLNANLSGQTDEQTSTDIDPPLSSEQIAPLIPLNPQYPLSLTQTNRELFIDNPTHQAKEKKWIQDQLEAHTFPWLTLIILIGAGGIGWAAYLTRDDWFKNQLKPVKSISPKQQAEEALSALKKHHFLEQGLIHTYYMQLTSILLTALQARLDWKKKELTTSEITQALNTESILSLNQKQNLLSFLNEMDQVKFAGKQPSIEDAQQMDQSIHRFIQQLFLSN